MFLSVELIHNNSPSNTIRKKPKANLKCSFRFSFLEAVQKVYPTFEHYFSNPFLLYSDLERYCWGARIGYRTGAL